MQAELQTLSNWPCRGYSFMVPFFEDDQNITPDNPITRTETSSKGVFEH